MGLVRSIRILVSLSTIPYAFVAAWFDGRYYYDPPLPGPLGFLVPEIILTPPIIALILLRTSSRWMAVTLAAALLSGEIGVQLGASAFLPEPMEIPPFLAFILVFLFHAPLLALWTWALTMLIRSIRKVTSGRSLG